MSKLKDYCINITDGEHGSIKDNPTGEFYFLNNNNITQTGIEIHENDRKMSREDYEKIHKRTQMAQGDVVIATCGTLGKTQVITDENPKYEFSRSVGIIKCDKNKLLPEYLHYYFMQDSVQKRIRILAKGAVQKHFYIGDMQDFELEIPDISIQGKIVKTLSLIDDKIRNNNAISFELESLARTIYDYWFLQFDFPDENGRPYRSSGGRMVYNEELKSEIPEGWEAKKLRDISTLLMNTVNPYDNPDKEYLHYSIPAFDDTGYPSIELGEEISSGKYIVPDDSILVSKLNPQFKRVWSPQVNGNNCICSTEFIPFVAINKEIHGYLYSVLDSDSFQQYMMQCSSSSTGSRKRMQPELCGDFTIAYPKDKKIIEKFSRFIDRILSKKANCSVENQQLTSLRDFLLPLLMNGQVTFKH